MVSDETFFAWLDGELDPAQAAMVEAEVAADPRLSARAAEHRAMQQKLSGAFDALLSDPVPDRLAAAARKRAAAQVVDLAQAKHAREARRFPVAIQLGAMAASLAVGILVGTMASRPRDMGPVTAEGSNLYANAGLGRALDTQLASAPRGDIRIGMTFRDGGGAICRTFMTKASTGLACRQSDKWRVRGLFGTPEGQTGDYRMAGGMEPDLADMVETTMRGEPFDAAQEQAAKQRQWR
jgi:hypothetical protein